MAELELQPPEVLGLQQQHQEQQHDQPGLLGLQRDIQAEVQVM